MLCIVFVWCIVLFKLSFPTSCFLRRLFLFCLPVLTSVDRSDVSTTDTSFDIIDSHLCIYRQTPWKPKASPRPPSILLFQCYWPTSHFLLFFSPFFLSLANDLPHPSFLLPKGGELRLTSVVENCLLHQMVNNPPKGNNILDSILTTDVELMNSFDVWEKIEKNDHQRVSFTINIVFNAKRDYMEIQ